MPGAQTVNQQGNSDIHRALKEVIYVLKDRLPEDFFR
jgi:hypothetical protein